MPSYKSFPEVNVKSVVSVASQIIFSLNSLLSCTRPLACIINLISFLSCLLSCLRGEVFAVC